MNARLQVIRFRATSAPPAPDAAARAVLDVHVDSAAAVGQVVFFANSTGSPSWRYVFRDGRPSGLESDVSRVDLETLIIEHYFENLLPQPQSA